MEIISYLKGKKAQEEMQKVHQVIGQDVFKHGDKDIIDTSVDADARIAKLEASTKDRVLSEKIEEVTKKTAIAINKQIVKAGALNNAHRYKLTNLVFENFSDLTSVNTSVSQNIKLNEALGLIQIENNSKEAELVLNKVDTGDASILILTFKGYGASSFDIVLDLETAEFVNVEKIDNKIRLKKIKDVVDAEETSHEVFEKSGEIIFKGLELNEDAHLIEGINLMKSGSINVFINNEPFLQGEQKEIAPLVDINFKLKAVNHLVPLPIQIARVGSEAGLESVSAPIQPSSKKYFNVFSDYKIGNNVVTIGSSKGMGYEKLTKKEFDVFDLINSTSVFVEEKYIQLTYEIK